MSCDTTRVLGILNARPCKEKVEQTEEELRSRVTNAYKSGRKDNIKRQGNKRRWFTRRMRASDSNSTWVTPPRGEVVADAEAASLPSFAWSRVDVLSAMIIAAWNKKMMGFVGWEDINWCLLVYRHKLH